jgi:glucose-1-phosphate cytidylyltransferase
MKVVILAGGLGTRLAEETEVRPKPMIEIGGRPILWHILKHYAHYGCREFFVALGYKGEIIKRYFSDYCSLRGDLTVDMASGRIRVHRGAELDWVVHLLDTGQHTNTGGRIKRLEPYLQDGPFMATYGDGVSNVDLEQLVRFHHAQGRTATITAVRPPARFGALVLDDARVQVFSEKPQAGEGWINGGYLVIEPSALPMLDGDASSLEVDLLEPLAASGELAAYRHEQFWQCMDTLRDKRMLESMWETGTAPWKVWP